MPQSLFSRLLSRRNFLKTSIYSAVALLLPIGCKKGAPSSSPNAVSLGIASAFKEGETPFPFERVTVFKARHNSGWSFRALSLVCTHQTCLVRSEPSGFHCPCHGSQFSKTGEVLTGPAEKPLPWLKLSVTDSGELLLHPNQSVHGDEEAIIG